MKVIPLFDRQAQLIRRAAQHKPGAQRALYERYAPRMLSICRQYVRDLQHAEDVMLSGFFKVFNRLETYRHEGSFEGWIRRIMVRESIDFIRRRQQIDFADDIDVQEEEGVESVDGALHAAHIQELIDQLPEGYKLVFVLYAVEGYNHAEIAEMLHITVGTSKSQLFKARRMLQRQLNQENLSTYEAGEL